MHRRPLLDMLAAYRQIFPAEADVVDRICHLVQTHANCFDRTCRPGHITGAAWILSADRRRSLLTHHRKFGRWLQLGGHADGQWQIEQVALREAREESGMKAFDFIPIDGALLPLDLDVHDIPARCDTAGQIVEDAHEHHDVRFLLIAQPDQRIRVSEESLDVAWFTSDEVLELTTDESVLRMLRKALALVG
ncbi:MAG TPA: NUDIX hydrolase [Lacipirellulaceae bacterium]|jgi:8-oxo-dGTP pyrophosphatase MutT (NUDIX family)